MNEICSPGRRTKALGRTTHSAAGIFLPYPPLTPIFSCVMFSICFDVTSVCLISIQSLTVLSFLVPYWLDWLALVCLFRCLSNSLVSHRNLRAKKHHHNHNSFGIFVKSRAPYETNMASFKDQVRPMHMNDQKRFGCLGTSLSPPSLKKRAQYVFCFAILFEFISSHIPRQVLRHNSTLVFLSSMISILLWQ